MPITRFHLLVSIAASATLSAAAIAADSGFRVADQISGLDGGWDYASFDPATGRVFVARTDAVMAIDTASRVVTPRLAPADHAHAVMPVPGTNELLMTDGTSNTAQLIDKTSGTIRARIAVGQKPDAAIYDAITKTAIVMNAKSGTVSFIDPARAAVTATVTLSPGLEFAAIDGKRHLFVANEDSGTLQAIDLRTHAVLAPVAMPGCEEPSGLAYLAKADRLIAACANGKAAVVDPAHGELVELIDIGLGPDAVLADQAHDRVFIPCGGSGMLDVIAFDRKRKGQRTARITTEIGARTGAIDEASGTIYLPSARFGPKPASGRAPVIPGSFHVLVIKPGVVS